MLNCRSCFLLDHGVTCQIDTGGAENWKWRRDDRYVEREEFSQMDNIEKKDRKDHRQSSPAADERVGCFLRRLWPRMRSSIRRGHLVP